MELRQLRCFVAVADELHFGRAARRLEMLPAALGRSIRLLEAELGVSLLVRTTRTVSLSPEGADILEGAKELIGKADALALRAHQRGRSGARPFRIGAIDTASAGLVPMLLKDFRKSRPTVVVQLVEDKSVRLLPKLLTGAIDLALVRPPLDRRDERIAFRLLFHETAVVAVPKGHALASRKRLTIAALAGEPLIVPDRRSRPHSHDLTIKLFEHAGLRPRIVQVAEEKQTIVNLVAAGIGLAIVPRWTSRMALAGVRYVPLRMQPGTVEVLPLAAAWARGSRDPLRDELLGTLDRRLGRYAAEA